MMQVNQLHERFVGEISGVDTSVPPSPELIAAVDRIAVTFRDLLKRDRAVPARSRQHVGFLIAFRPWNFSIYDEIRK